MSQLTIVITSDDLKAIDERAKAEGLTHEAVVVAAVRAELAADAAKSTKSSSKSKGKKSTAEAGEEKS